MSRTVAAVGVLMIVLVALDAALVADRHAAPGVVAVLGVMSACAIVMVAKGLGKFLQRPGGRDE